LAGNALKAAVLSSFTTIPAPGQRPTGAVTLSGTATQGQTLSATQTLADADGLGPISLRWQVSGNGTSGWTDVPGASGASFSPAASHVGQYTRAVASYSDGLGTAESVASAASRLIGALVTGTSGIDALSGTPGDDRLDGGAGADRLSGGPGHDTYLTDIQADLVFENPGEGTDTVLSSASYYLYPHVENLTLSGSAFFGVGNELDNTLIGNSSENLLIGGTGADTLRGGEARDALFGESGTDALYGEAGIDYLVAGTGNDTVDGGPDADEIYGQEGNDSLLGGSDFATDILVGGEGNDTIDGGPAWDQMYGGPGDDTFIVSQQVDWVFEQPGEGTDAVIADSPNGYYLYANVENLSLIGTTPFGVGNELANLIMGNASANVLLGGAGNDTLDGGAEQDLLWGQDGADTFRFTKGTGTDIVADFQAGTDKLDVRAYGFTTLAQAKARMVQVGGDVAFDLGGGDSVILIGVSLASLGAVDLVLGPPGG
jgi:Ca2+-binding RTX toxin-like protein